MAQSQIRVVSATDAPSTRRVQRRPQHSFNLKSKPYQLVPFMCAPVLPGETMQSLLMQARVVSDPILNPLIGWHKEYYWFYVSHRGMSRTDTSGKLQAMMLDPATDMTSLKATANSIDYYTFNGGINFVTMAYVAALREFFRDEDDTGDYLLGNYHLAQMDQDKWHHSLKRGTFGLDDSELPGVDEQEELDILPGMTSNYAQWELMRDAQMTDLTYEDYLKSYGIDVPSPADSGADPVSGIQNRFAPELLRFSRSWTYPTNHVDPTTGAPSSAVSWSIAERADKKRLFKEPGVIIGLTCTRPKLYLGNQMGSAVGLLNDAYAWLPAVLMETPYTSVRPQTFSAVAGILQNQPSDYWLDARDLFMHGDQFVNHAMTAAANHGIAMPGSGASDVDKKWPTEAMINSLFKTVGSEFVREDGVVHLNILSRVRDTTP